MKYPVVETIKKRRSVRSYENRVLSSQMLKRLEDYFGQTSNPFGAKVEMRIAQKSIDGEGEKLGTYGIIKGASIFLGVCVEKSEHALLGAGYQFEDLILYATSLGLGTVWLAGTFTRDKFQTEMGIPTDYLFPAITPVGYPIEKRFFERIMRKAIGADKRKPWEELFFENNFATPLTKEAAGKYAVGLEMLRLAPSAVNAQPWRVVKIGDTFHFYEMHKENANEKDVLIKQVDMGIGIFHFDKTMRSEGTMGQFVFDEPQNISVPSTFHYVASWKN